MTADPKPAPDLRRAPDAPVRRRRRISAIWLVPVVAGAVAAWLAAVTLREQGPTVTITFDSAEGLEAGKTKVRYKDVEVGTVEEVRLSDDLEGVAAVARLSKQVEPFVRRGTRFWVVRPRVGASGVSGLGTLLSGAYIGLDPGGASGPPPSRGCRSRRRSPPTCRGAGSSSAPRAWARPTAARRCTTGA